jgi:CRISPR-associated endoribonuclease Cas6
MRIHLKIDTKKQVIPFFHQPLLVGCIHKWLGRNTEHGALSLYSFSRLAGGRATQKGLKFDKETSFFFSAHDPTLISKIATGIMKDRTMFYGLEVIEVLLKDNPDLSAKERFMPASPILVKRSNEDYTDHILFNDPVSATCMEKTLRTKMERAGIVDDTLEIRFDATDPRAETQIITYNGIQNKTNWCPIIIKGKPETKLFVWNTGIGNSTGIGLGAIK